MRRGTRVGQAYVAITADGTGINEEIVDAVDEAGPDVRKKGEEHGETYGDEFGESLRVKFSHAGDKAGAELNRRMADAGTEGGEDYGDSVEKSLKRAAKRIGKSVGKSIGEALSDNLELSIARMIDLLEDRVAAVSGNGGRGSGGGGGGGGTASGGREFPPRDPDDRLWAQAARMHEEWARRNGLRMEQAIRMDADRERRLGLMVERALKMDEDRNRRLGLLQERALKMDEDRERRIGLMVERALKMDEDRDRRIASMQARAIKMNEERDRKLGLQHERALTMNEDRDQRLGRMQEAALRMNRDRDDRLAKLEEDRIQRLGRMQEAALRLNAKFNEGKVDGTGNVKSSGGSKGGGIDDIIGRMLGKGSRNNALNLFGKTMGGIVGLMDKAGKFAGGFANGMQTAAAGASMAQKFMAGISGGAGAIGGLGKGLASFAAAAPLVVAAAAVMFISLSALASVISALTALAVAMASTIASALVGALAVAAPAIAALIVAGGLLTAAFTSMTDAQRDYLANAFQPLKAAMTGIGQIIITEFMKPLANGQSAFQIWSKNLQRAIIPLSGLAKLTAGAFADAGRIITHSLSGPGFGKFFEALGTELPKIVRSLSGAFGSFLNGVTGMFAAIMPRVSQFAGHLEKVAASFSKWVNSPKGQNSIKDFVDRAITSLQSLWGAAKEIWGWLTDLLFDPASQKAGNTIFDGIKNAFKRFRDAINTGELERWFTDAIEFGKDLKRVIGQLKDTFQKLDNSGVLDAVGSGIEAIASAVETANKFLGPMVDIMGVTLPNAMKVAVAPVNALADAVGWLTDKIETGIDRLTVLKNMSPTSILSRGFDAVTGGGGGTNPSAVPQGETPSGPIGVDPRSFVVPTSGFTADRAFEMMQRRRTTPGHDHDGPDRDTNLPNSTLNDLVKSGNAALAQTDKDHGGTKVSGNGKGSGKKGGGIENKTPEWKNPYIDMANRILATAAKLADDIRASTQEARNTLAAALADSTKTLTALLAESGKDLVAGVLDASKSTDAQGVIDSFATMIENLGTNSAAAIETATANGAAAIESAKATRDQMIASAEAAVQSAAQRLHSASNKKEAKAALAELDRAQADLALAKQLGNDLVAEAQAAADKMIKDATATKEQMDAASAILQGQSVLTPANVQQLLSGFASTTATLADYAEARRIVGERLVDANQKLAEAISLRDDYSASVADSVRSFGSLMTAQARTLNGVTQAITAGDITTNLRDRLEKIKTFQSNLRLLLAQGLSDEAYKQLVDAGVDGAGGFAQALVDGGQGSISEVNNLTSQIGDAADGLGDTAASRLYQAGVDAAQGLVDGLMSLSAQLDSAAEALGLRIATAVKNALGIASPSRVLRSMMTNVGDGVALGLDDQHVKVGAASARLSGKIAVSPEVAAYAAQVDLANRSEARASEVSGNGDPKFLWTGDIVTPTEDPQAVANEVLNELTGRL